MGTTAFVLSGGGSLGAVQVGMLRALADHGVKPDLLIGTSVGALNAAFIAGHGLDGPSIDRLADIWLRMRRRDVFPLDPLRLGAAAIGRAPSLCDARPLRALIKRNLTFERVEDAPIPLRVVTTDVRSGREVVLSEGDAVDAVTASAAIPAVFPAVAIGGRDLIDGGIADNAAVSQALACGADTVYVLPTGYACALEEPPATPLASALQAITLLIEQRLIVEVLHLSQRADIQVMPPVCPLSVASTDFRHAAELIERSHEATRSWLRSDVVRPAHPEQVLSLHSHPRTA